MEKFINVVEIWVEYRPRICIVDLGRWTPLAFMSKTPRVMSIGIVDELILVNKIGDCHPCDDRPT